MFLNPKFSKSADGQATKAFNIAFSFSLMSLKSGLLAISSSIKLEVKVTKFATRWKLPALLIKEPALPVGVSNAGNDSANP